MHQSHRKLPLLALLALHIGGALLHAFKADGFVRRMLRP